MRSVDVRQPGNHIMGMNDLIASVWSEISAERLLLQTHRYLCAASPTGQEREFSLLYAEALREIGLEVTLDEEFPESPSVIGWWPHPTAGPPGFPASPKGTGTARPGRGRPVLQFDGHTDTIPTPHAPPTLEYDPAWPGGGRVRGRGAADMKGGLAAVVEALRAVRAAGIALEGSVLVTAHGLHEAPLGDQRTLHSLIRKGIHGDAALVVELGESLLPIAAKGMAIFRIEISRLGAPMHEAEMPPDLPHPLRAAGRLLGVLEEHRQVLQGRPHGLSGPESIFLGEVHGGDFYNRVPVSARIVGTHRFAAPRTLAEVRAEYDVLCRTVAQETGATISIEWQEVGRPFELAVDEPLVRSVRSGFQAATGQELPVRGINVVGNAADLVGYAGIPAVYHGVNQTTAHADDEWVSAADLVRAARVYAWCILDYLGATTDSGRQQIEDDLSNASDHAEGGAPQ